MPEFSGSLSPQTPRHLGEGYSLPVDPKTTFLDTDLNAAMYVYLVPVSVRIHTLYNATIPEDEIRNNNYDAVGMPVWMRVIIM